MGLNVFGGGPADVTSDSSGDVVGGISMKVYTAALGGQRVTDLYDMDGSPLAGVVVSGTSGDDEGRVAFQSSDQYQVLFLDAGYGMRWAVPAREAFSAAYTALQNASTALDTAQGASVTADDAKRTADEALNKVGKYADLDIMNTNYQYVTQFRTPSDRVVQSFGKNLNTGDYFGAQTADIDSSGNSTTIIYHMSPAGEVISKSNLMWAGHGSSIDVEADGDDTYIWTWWSQSRNGTPSGSRLIRWKYEPGLDVDLDDPSVEIVTNLDGDTYTTAGIDQHNDLVALRIPRGGASGSSVDFHLRRLSEFGRSNSRLLASIVNIPAGDAGAYQGHTTLGDHLYVAQGGVSGFPATITRYNWYTGDSSVLDVSSAAANSLGELPGGHAEIEKVAAWHTKDGRQVLLFGMATGTGGYRQSLVYGFTPVGSPDAEADVARALSQSFQSGSVYVTPTAGVVTTAEVRFQWEFAEPPQVVVTPVTVSDQVLKGGGVGVANVTTSGFTVSFMRLNSSSMYITWMAYCGPGMNGRVIG